jgi:thiamine kinase-like enzyme
MLSAFFPSSKKRQTASEVVGEGTYGCVHKPQLNCVGEKPVPSNKLSKLMKDEEAASEFKEYGIMENVDPKHNFYLGSPKMCKVDINLYNKNSASKCKRLKESDAEIINNLAEYTLMIMEDGGDNLEDFAEKAKEWPSSKENSQRIEQFWLEAHKALAGVKAFLDYGVVHHDLKPQNLVYNVETGRINFIDFGLMTKKDAILQQAASSKYGMSIYHWSFPLDTFFLNRKSYNKFANYTTDTKERYIKNIAKNLKSDKDSAGISAVKYFLYHSSNVSGELLNRGKVTETTLKGFGETLLHQIVPGDSQYKTVVNKCVDTIDIYGVGIGLLFVLKTLYKEMDTVLVGELEPLLLDMVNANVMERIDINTALNRYEGVLEKCGILNKYNKHFANHVLTEGPPIPLVLEKDIASIKASAVSISPQEMDQILEKDPEALEPETSIHKTTGKRVRIRSASEAINGSLEQGETRQPSVAKQPLVAKTGEPSRKKTRKLVIRTNECPEGKELNPITRRCVNRCKEGEVRNERFECRRTQRKWTVRKNKMSTNSIK